MLFRSLLTYVGALLPQMERFDKVRAVGIFLALIGALAIAIPKLNRPADSGKWVAATLVGGRFLRLATFIVRCAGRLAYTLIVWLRACWRRWSCCCRLA